MIQAVLQQIWLFVAVAALLFFVGVAVGIVSVESDPTIAEDAIDQVIADFAFIADLPPLAVSGIIFLNNIVKAFLAVALGAFLGLVPLLMLIGNGFLLGAIVGLEVQAGSVAQLLALLAPHGIIELPALFIAAGLGLHLGLLAIRDRSRLKEGYKQALKMYLYLIIPLLFIAALIETFISPLVLNLF